MHAPQIIVFVLLGISLLLGARNHGTTTTQSFWHKFADAIITIGLLYWGGFFSH